MALAQRSRSTLVLFLIAAVVYFVLAVTILACGFYIDTKYETDVDTNYTDYSHHYTNIEELVEGQWTGTQYWLGFPMLVTSALMVMSGVFQQHRLLNTLAFLSFVVCITLSMFAIIIDSAFWVWWENDRRKLNLWQDKHGLICKTIEDSGPSESCVCGNDEKEYIKIASYFLGCSDLKTLPGLYAGVTVSAIFCFVLSLLGIVFYSKASPWKTHISYVRTEFVNASGEEDSV